MELSSITDTAQRSLRGFNDRIHGPGGGYTINVGHSERLASLALYPCPLVSGRKCPQLRSSRPKSSVRPISTGREGRPAQRAAQTGFRRGPSPRCMPASSPR